MTDLGDDTIELIAAQLTRALADARRGFFCCAGGTIQMVDHWIFDCQGERRDRARALSLHISIECRALEREMVRVPKPSRGRKSKRQARAAQGRAA